MNSSRQPVLRLIYTTTILHYLNGSFGSSKCVEIHTFSIICAKPGLKTDTLLIRALPSLRRLWLLSLSVLSFPTICWSHSWASQDLVWPCTPRLHMNPPKASWITCAMHSMWLPIAGHSIPEASRDDCIYQVIESFEGALLVIIPSKRPSVSTKPSKTSFKCLDNLAAVLWPLT